MTDGADDTGGGGRHTGEGVGQEGGVCRNVGNMDNMDIAGQVQGDEV